MVGGQTFRLPDPSDLVMSRAVAPVQEKFPRCSKFGAIEADFRAVPNGSLANSNSNLYLGWPGLQILKLDIQL